MPDKATNPTRTQVEVHDTLTADQCLDFLSVGPRGLYTVAATKEAIDRWVAEGWAHAPHAGEFLYHRHDTCPPA